MDFQEEIKPDGSIKRYKAQLVVKGYKELIDFDYFDTYAPMMRISAIVLLIDLTTIKKIDHISNGYKFCFP